MIVICRVYNGKKFTSPNHNYDWSRDQICHITAGKSYEVMEIDRSGSGKFKIIDDRGLWDWISYYMFEDIDVVSMLRNDKLEDLGI